MKVQRCLGRHQYSMLSSGNHRNHELKCKSAKMTVVVLAVQDSLDVGLL